MRAITGGDATGLAEVAASVTGSSLTAQSDDELLYGGGGGAGPSGDEQPDPAQQQLLHAEFGRAGDAAALPAASADAKAALGGGHGKSGRVLSKMERAHIISGAVHCLVGSMTAARRLSVMGPSDEVGATEERSPLLAFHRPLSPMPPLPLQDVGVSRRGSVAASVASNLPVGGTDPHAAASVAAAAAAAATEPPGNARPQTSMGLLGDTLASAAARFGLDRVPPAPSPPHSLAEMQLTDLPVDTGAFPARQEFNARVLLQVCRVGGGGGGAVVAHPCPVCATSHDPPVPLPPCRMRAPAWPSHWAACPPTATGASSSRSPCPPPPPLPSHLPPPPP